MEMVARRVVAVVMFVSLFLVFGGYSAQAQTPGSMIVGTWTIFGYGGTVVFNANGTVTGLPPWQMWTVVGDMMALFSPGSARRGVAIVHEFRLSSDGSLLLIFEQGDREGTLRGRRN